MSFGNVFVATTLAPLVIVLASISLQLLTMGLEQLKKWSSHSNSKNALWPIMQKANYIINTKCFGDMEIDVKSFNNVMLMAILMALIGVALTLGSMEDAARAGGKPKTSKSGTTLSRLPKKTK